MTNHRVDIMDAGLAAIPIIIGIALVLASVGILYDQYNNNYSDAHTAFLHAKWASAAESYLPPQKQVESGTLPKDVICKDIHILVIRTDQSPACVSESTANAMIKRGGIIQMIIGPTAGLPENSAHDGATGGNASQLGSMAGSIDGRGQAVQDDMMTGRQNMTGMGASITGSDGSISEAGSNNSSSNNSNGNKTGTDKEDVPHDASSHAHSATGRVSSVPASSMSTVNFYVTDDDLNRAPNAAETVSTSGLFEFTINGIPITGPDTMTETGPDTGRFHVKLTLPDTIDGRPLNHNDVVSITYLDQTDSSGEQRAVSRSFALSSTYAQINSEGDGNRRIGHEFTLRIYEPDANRDSKKSDRIPLSMFEFKGEGSTRATLDHGAFDANRSHMTETGPNTGVFEVVIKIPRQIDGKTIHIGDKYEITYHDYSTPSGSPEEIVLSGRIGL